MKSDLRRLPQLLRDLPRLRVVCLYGDDADGIRDAARRLVTATAGSLDDPFRVTLCEGDQRDAVASALASPPLTGGRAVVWVRQAGERLAPCVADATALLSGPLLLLEYAAATGRSKLRGLVERAERGAIVACYAQPETTRDAVRASLAAAEVEVDDGAVALLAGFAAATQQTGAQIGRLAALYAGSSGRLQPADVEKIAGVAAAGSEQGWATALPGGLAGDSARLDAAIEAALADGGAVAVLRGALLQLQRLRVLAAALAEGRSLPEAGRGLRPPLFAREEGAVAAALQLWSSDQLGSACRAVARAERLGKNSGAPQDALCREALAGLGRAAAGRRVPPRQPPRPSSTSRPSS